MIKILLAEDTKDLNRVITAGLEHMGYVVDSAFDGLEASAFIDQNGYDVIILDIMMPHKDGIQVLTDLRAKHVTSPVLMLTAKAEIDDKVAGLDAGADDYLAKPFEMKELFARIRALARRKTEYSDEAKVGVVTYGDIELDASTNELRCASAVRLSVKEFELISRLIDDAGDYVAISDLLSDVWSDTKNATEYTLRLYIMYLEGKLNAISSKVRIDENEGDSYRLVSANE